MARDSVINLDIQWIGEPRCGTESSFLGQFRKCTLDFNTDANLVANFILGFASMHLCDESTALRYFTKVNNDIEKEDNLSVRSKLFPLRELIGKYSSYVASKNKKSTIDTAGSRIATVNDEFTNIPFDSVRPLIRNVYSSGELGIGVPGQSGTDISTFPAYIIKTDKRTKLFYKFDLDNTYYELNLDSSSISYSTGQSIQYIEAFIKKNYPGSQRYKFNESIKFITYAHGNEPLSNHKGPFIGIECDIAQDSLPYFIDYVTYLQSTQTFDAFSIPNTPFLSVPNAYPVNILLSKDTIIIIYQDKGRPQKIKEIKSGCKSNSPNYFESRDFDLLDINAYIKEKYPNYSHHKIFQKPIFR